MPDRLHLGPRGAQDWETPPELFRALDQEFRFTVDAAADGDNALVGAYWGKATDGLTTDWSGETVWCNPPFNETRLWVAKAAETRAPGTAVLLIPASIDVRWWNDVVLPTATEIRFIKGRVRFLQGGELAPAVLPRPMCVVIWHGGRRPPGGPGIVWGWTWPGRHSSWAAS